MVKVCVIPSGLAVAGLLESLEDIMEVVNVEDLYCVPQLLDSRAVTIDLTKLQGEEYMVASKVLTKLLKVAYAKKNLLTVLMPGKRVEKDGGWVVRMKLSNAAASFLGDCVLLTKYGEINLRNGTAPTVKIEDRVIMEYPKD